MHRNSSLQSGSHLRPTGGGVIPVAALLVPLLAVALSFLFWSDLWMGGGLIGGDLYTYFFPQKTFFVSRLREGEFPLWNNLVGHGYPLVAESQTGVFYPPHLLYLFLDANSAYNSVQLLHYVLAFVFFWLYARSVGLSNWASALSSLVYTYSWFPARLCLEWAIIGGAWLPLALWSIERFLISEQWRYLILLSLGVALQMLPGHFNLAFITLLVIVPYFFVRYLSKNPESRELGRTIRPMILLGIAIFCSFGIAAVQLAPTWELKRHSQRSDVNLEHDPRYGNLPAWFLVQVVNPSIYTDPDLDNRLNAGLPPSASTNKVEAHLYFGIIPFFLAIGGIVRGGLRKHPLCLLWVVLGFLGVLYSTGRLVPLTHQIPGFSFFKGPGRFGIVSTVAVAVLSGFSLDRLRRVFRPSLFRFVAFLVVGFTFADLWGVSRIVGYVSILPQSLLYRISQSHVRRILSNSAQPVRLFSRGPNLPTLLGVSSTPEYLGIGPSEYYDPATRMPLPLPYDSPPTPEHLVWLRHAGVTHILSHSPLHPDQWPVTPLWSGLDPFLNPAWGRREPLFLYAFQGGRPRLSWDHPGPNDTAEIRSYMANEVRAEVDSSEGGRLILTDLQYPGWNVFIDDRVAAPLVIDGMFRGVLVPPGKHSIHWKFESSSIWIGALISLVTLLFLAGVSHLRYWHPKLFSPSTDGGHAPPAESTS